MRRTTCLILILCVFTRADPNPNATDDILLQRQSVLSEEALFQANDIGETAFEAAYKFDKLTWIGKVADDPFYKTPSNFPTGVPGAILRHEVVAGDKFTAYTTLNPSISFHRILYESTNLNGNPVPASAYLLLPQTHPSTSPLKLLVWAHGTSGILRNCAPSNQKDLQYGWMGPLAMVTRGYAVLAPDYAGLGSEALFEYHAAPAHGADILAAILATRKLFPFGTISKEWLVIGHSEGGLAAWGTNEIYSQKEIGGFLGSVSIAPAFDALHAIMGDSMVVETHWGGMPYGVLIFIAISRLYPSFKVEDYLTEKALQLWKLMETNGACANTALGIFSNLAFREVYTDLSWINKTEALEWQERTSILGKKTLSKPALVIEALGDFGTPPQSIEKILHNYCVEHPDSQVHLTRYPGLDHWSILYASQAEYFKWVEDRFEENPVVNAGCTSGRPSTVE